MTQKNQLNIFFTIHTTCTSLSRLQEEAVSTKIKAKEAIQSASVTAEEDQRRASESERRLQEMIQSLEQQLNGKDNRLAEQRAAAAALEQRAVALETALNQANVAAAAMASRVTETMAEGAAQVIKASLLLVSLLGLGCHPEGATCCL